MSNIDPQDETIQLTPRQTSWLLVSVLVVALCGIAYELIIAAVSSYLLGNSVAQFSITIGLFMFSMGIGSYLTKFIHTNLVVRFVQIEIAVAFVGGICAAILFFVFPYYALYKPTMYSLILVIGTLVGLEIPILTRILIQEYFRIDRACTESGLHRCTDWFRELSFASVAKSGTLSLVVCHRIAQYLRRRIGHHRSKKAVSKSKVLCDSSFFDHLHACWGGRLYLGHLQICRRPIVC